MKLKDIHKLYNELGTSPLQDVAIRLGEVKKANSNYFEPSKIILLETYLFKLKSNIEFLSIKETLAFLQHNRIEIGEAKPSKGIGDNQLIQAQFVAATLYREFMDYYIDWIKNELANFPSIVEPFLNRQKQWKLLYGDTFDDTLVGQIPKSAYEIFELNQRYDAMKDRMLSDEKIMKNKPKALELLNELKTLYERRNNNPHIEESYHKHHITNLDQIINSINFYTPKKQKEIEVNKGLEMFFESISKYKYVMELLVSENHVHPNTYIWKDESNGNKSFLAALIKDLHGKNYYKLNIKPTNIETKGICQESFGRNISLDTIKKSHSKSFDFTFIPYASEIT